MLGIKPSREMSIFDTFHRFWTEVARHTPYGRNTQLYQMRVLAATLGPETLLSALDDECINDAVQRMRTPVPKKGRPEQLSSSSINRYLTTLNAICTRARKIWKAEVGDWTKGEHVQREPEGREVFLTHEQAGKLLSAACGHLRPILTMAFMTGLRRENIMAIDWNQVSLDMARITLVQKGRRRHAVTLPPPAVAMLERIEPDPDRRSGPVWRFGNPAVTCDCPRCTNGRYAGNPIRSVKRTFATAVRAAGLTNLAGGSLRFHDIRHTFASWLLDQGGNLKTVQEALGHKHVETTARYSHLLPGAKDAVIVGVADRLMQHVEPTITS